MTSAFNLGYLLFLIDILLHWFVVLVIYFLPLTLSILFIKSFERILLEN